MQDNDTLSPIQLFFRNKWIRAILLVNVVIIIAVIAIAIYNSTKTAIITFNITPLDATISVNGNTNYNTTSTYRLHPGTYNITILHDNLDFKTFELNLPSNSSTLLSTYLTSDNGTNFSFYELKENHESAQKLLSIASPDNNQTYDHDTSAEQFVIAYGATLNAFDAALPIIESTRETPDNGGRLLSLLSIQKDDSCEKYTCVLVSGFGYPNINETINQKIHEAGLDQQYLEIKYEAQ